MNECRECCCDCDGVVLEFVKSKGQAFYSRITTKTKEGTIIDKETISNVEFTLYDFDNKVKYTKDYLYDEPTKTWTLTIPTIVTNEWEAGTCKYKVWFEFIDGNKEIILEGLYKIKE